MSESPPRPGGVAPTPGPRPGVPTPPGDGRELAEALHHLAGLDQEDLDGVLAAAETAHQRLRDRLGHAGGR